MGGFGMLRSRLVRSLVIGGVVTAALLAAAAAAVRFPADDSSELPSRGVTWAEGGVLLCTVGMVFVIATAVTYVLVRRRGKR